MSELADHMFRVMRFAEDADLKLAMDLSWWERLIERTGWWERWSFVDDNGRRRRYWRRNGSLPRGYA